MGKGIEKDRARRARWFGSKTTVSVKPTLSSNKTSPQPQNKPYTITAVPRSAIPNLPKEWAVISVTDRHSYPPDLRHFADKMAVEVNMSYGKVTPLSEEVVTQLLEFVIRNANRTIAVQCGEGACRSPAIAEGLSHSLGPLSVDFKLPYVNQRQYPASELTWNICDLADNIINSGILGESLSLYESKAL